MHSAVVLFGDHALKAIITLLINIEVKDVAVIGQPIKAVHGVVVQGEFFNGPPP